MPVSKYETYGMQQYLSSEILFYSEQEIFQRNSRGKTGMSLVQSNAAQYIHRQISEDN